MRRRYSVICGFLAGFFVLSLLCYGSYRYSQRNEPDGKKMTESRKTGTEKERKITKKTRYIVERYDTESGETVRTEKKLPADYVGMTRDQLQTRLSERMLTISKKEEEEGLSGISLQSFSSGRIVVRYIYTAEEPKGFMLKILDGEVAIYSADGKKLYEKTGLPEEELTESDRKQLRRGRKVENEKELYSILENFSS